MSSPKDCNISVGFDDPFEAIFALNVGDFVAEDFLSEELLKRINTSINASPEEKSQRLKEQLHELVSIYSINNTLNLLGFVGEEGFVVYDSIAVTIANMLSMDCCNIFLKPDILPLLPKKNEKELILFGTSHPDKRRDHGYKFGDTEIITKSYRERKTVYIPNVKKELYWKPAKVMDEDKIVTLVTVPLMFGRVSIGFIAIYSYEEKELPKEYLELIDSIASIFSVSVKLQDLMEEANELMKEESPDTGDLTRLRAQLTSSIGDLGIQQQRFVEALALAVDAKSKYTHEHSRSVAEIAREIATELNLNEKTIDLIYYAGLLQNIGKIMIPDAIFSKKGNLTDEDWKKLQEHPNVGVDLLMKVNFLSEVVPYVHYYRERWDGKGFPEGLKGMSIPFGSRIIAVADAYQAMVSDRAYREPLTVDQALKVMLNESGVKWDPVVVDALVAVKSR